MIPALHGVAEKFICGLAAARKQGLPFMQHFALIRKVEIAPFYADGRTGSRHSDGKAEIANEKLALPRGEHDGYLSDILCDLLSQRV